MSITTIDTNELRRMQDKEGLILQGCGGEPQDWLDGINELLTKEKILLRRNVYVEYSDRSNWNFGNCCGNFGFSVQKVS